MRIKSKLVKIKAAKIIKETDAYFTVEAALVMPFVLGAVFLTMYLLIFQYDRCLMEQSAGVLLLRGCSLQIEDGKALVSELLSQSENDDRVYVAWSMEEPEISLRGNIVTVKRKGELGFPVGGIAFWEGENHWESEADYKGYRIAPVSFIRDYRKIRGGK